MTKPRFLDFEAHLYLFTPPNTTRITQAAYRDYQKGNLTTCPHLTPSHKDTIFLDLTGRTAFCQTKHCFRKHIVPGLIDNPVTTRQCTNCQKPATTLVTSQVFYADTIVTAMANTCHDCHPTNF